MSPWALSGIVCLCVVGGIAIGMILRTLLPEQHLSAESKDVVKMGMGLVGTMTALVLGLMIASVKSSYDTQRSGVAQLSTQFIMLDRELAHYGPETKGARDMLRASVANILAQTWPHAHGNGQNPPTVAGQYEGLYDTIQNLTPQNERQRNLQAQALKTAIDAGQLRWSLLEQCGGSIPLPFLVVMATWLTLLFASFSLFASPNPTVVITLMISALAVSSAVFLILELDRPFNNVIQISSEPMQSAMQQLGR